VKVQMRIIPGTRPWPFCGTLLLAFGSQHSVSGTVPAIRTLLSEGDFVHTPESDAYKASDVHTSSGIGSLVLCSYKSDGGDGETPSGHAGGFGR
jgi:hypothetical protein